MKKIVFLLLLVVLSLSYSTTHAQTDFEQLDVERVKKDIDTIKGEMDSTAYYIKETGKIWAKSIKKNGFKNTMQKGKDIFLPIVIFLVLYLVWLRNRSRNN